MYVITMIVVHNASAQLGFIFAKFTIPDHNITGMIVKDAACSVSAAITAEHTLLIKQNILTMIEIYHASVPRLIVDKLTSYEANMAPVFRIENTPSISYQITKDAFLDYYTTDVK